MNIMRGTGRPARPRIRRQGCLRTAGVAVLFLSVAADVVIQASSGPAWPVLPVLVTGLAAVLWPAGRRPAWLTPTVRTAVPPLVSLAYTAVVAVSGREWPFGPGEVALMLCLLLVAVRTGPSPRVVLRAVPAGAAIVALPFRFDVPASDDAGMYGFMLLLVVLVGCVAGLGGYLRSLDGRRRLVVTDTRREERLAIAADLHDFVAHHVTGILVQTKVARMLARTEPERLDEVLEGVERAAGEALASMRRTVGLLRTEAGATDRRPVGDLNALTELVARFGDPAVLRRDPSVPDDLPHEIQSAAYRVAQEALTNVRRHAPDATKITVGLRHDGRNLEVTVRDDGRGGTRLLDDAADGGFGLIGLTERVTALGGELRAGRRGGAGWEVVALLPCAAPARRSPRATEAAPPEAPAGPLE